MKRHAILIAAALIAAPAALSAKPRLTGEERLSKMLEGREAGEPTSCIPIHRTNDSTVIDHTAIVHRDGNTIYVNRPRNADSLDSDDVMVVQIHGSQLCRLDMVTMHDRSGGFFTGFVGLEDFVPYRKVAAKD